MVDLELGIRLQRRSGGQERTRRFLREVEKKADELVRACEVTYLHAGDHQGLNPKGDTLPGGMITYQVVVRRERVYIVQITALEW
ncbi:hypothetical protein ABZZ17_20295 [Streptomyces sp. NPDC006512]|uniref:hypothetical protein n=1 Tax=Streptomyces sp. NPDC006512 TaxID=3154307 RepID=UPI0033B9B8CF